jgi:phosphoribosylanthranilate isomerase
MNDVEIKICGLTSPAQALECVAAGADAIGVVFHPPSPRHLTPRQAREIVKALPSGFPVVGVFGANDPDEVLATAEAAGIARLQLHQALPGPLIDAIFKERHLVFRFSRTGESLRTAAMSLPTDQGLLVECGRGPLPGGNGLTWDWGAAAVLRGLRPYAIAGGLNPANVAGAIEASGASAVDASSGLEATPGVKDSNLVRAFIRAARNAKGRHETGKVFDFPA